MQLISRNFGAGLVFLLMLPVSPPTANSIYNSSFEAGVDYRVPGI